MNAEKKIGLAKSRLVMTPKQGFFASVVLKRPIIYDAPNVATAAVDGFGTIYVNSGFVEELTIDQCVFLLAHEAMHHILRHSTRRRQRDAKAWNEAADYVINDTLKANNVGEFIPQGLYEEGARRYSAEQLYKAPPQQDEPSGGQGAQGGHTAQQDIGGAGNDLMDTPMTPEQEAQIDADIASEVNQAEKAQKMRGGHIDATLGRVIKKAKARTIPWTNKLQHLMQNLKPAEYTWTRPNKRFRHRGLYLPTTGKKPALGSVVVAIDTSGSLTDSELADFLKHANDILGEVNPEKVFVLHCDSAVRHVDTFTPDQYPIKADKAHGGGGTRFKPVFKYIDAELGNHIDALVYLTDGWGDQSSLDDRVEFPVIWATTDRVDFPFGDVVELRDF